MDKLRAAVTDLATRATRLVTRSGPDKTAKPRDAERGQGLAEYSLILAGIAVVAIVSLVFLGSVINGLFLDVIDVGFSHVVTDILGNG